jgi:hypothetical protein
MCFLAENEKTRPFPARPRLQGSGRICKADGYSPITARVSSSHCRLGLRSWTLASLSPRQKWHDFDCKWAQNRKLCVRAPKTLIGLRARPALEAVFECISQGKSQAIATISERHQSNQLASWVSSTCCPRVPSPPTTYTSHCQKETVRYCTIHTVCGLSGTIPSLGIQ